ncbi:hypothetical protein BGZ83_010502 [Gryganskiella cystojenkinii]|nr:hypothetical protein BGZ83_010502 [Gryganskiella cystojenkinii]
MSTPSLSSSTATKPTVLIIGAGLGGLTLAILLERAGIDYHIYERHHEFRALGSATYLLPNVQPLFEQLGLLEKLKSICKEAVDLDIFDAHGGLIGHMDVSHNKEMTSYHGLIMYRKDLHAFLLNEVPREKITLGRKVLSIHENDEDEGVIIKCSNGRSYRGDILVGCDGAYSAVRQSLYKTLAQAGKLPKSDGAQLKVHHRSILGTTGPLDTTKYGRVHEQFGRSGVFIGENSKHTWRYFCIRGGRVCWRIDTQLESKVFEESESFRLSEWDSETFRPDPELWSEFKTDLEGLSMRDLIELTPPEAISKVMLEEKLFETWYHGRTVLMGDACHKMLPNAGRGAMNALLDAVVLTNALYEMGDDVSSKSVLKAFKEYDDERHPHAKQELALSAQMAKTWMEEMTRKLILGYMPKWVTRKNTENGFKYRPQLSFLPQVPARGTVIPEPTKVSKSVDNPPPKRGLDKPVAFSYINSHATLSASALCASNTSYGAPFYSGAEDKYCDMTTKTLYKPCSKSLSSTCFVFVNGTLGVVPPTLSWMSSDLAVRNTAWLPLVSFGNITAFSKIKKRRLNKRSSQSITAGEALMSPNGRYMFLLQTNQVVYDTVATPMGVVWASGSYVAGNNEGYTVYIGSDGNVCIVSSPYSHVWCIFSVTHPTDLYTLTMQDSRVLPLIGQTTDTIWSTKASGGVCTDSSGSTSGCGAGATTGGGSGGGGGCGTSSIVTGKLLSAFTSLVNGNCRLTWNSSGNMMIMGGSDGATEEWTEKWTNNFSTYAVDVDTMTLQNDGNLCLSHQGTNMWCVMSIAHPTGTYTAKLSSSCVLSIVMASGSTIWASSGIGSGGGNSGGSCTPGYSGAKTGNGPNGACCVTEADCNSECTNGVCNGN